MEEKVLQRVQSSHDRFAERVRQQMEELRQQERPDLQRGVAEKEQLLTRYKEKKQATVAAQKQTEQRFQAENQRLDATIARLEEELGKERGLLRGVAVVPDLIGRAEIEAFVALQAVGLLLGARSSEPGSDQIGRVVAQNPGAAAEVELGSTVSLTIGGVQVPLVVGLTRAKAVRELEQGQLNTSVTGERTQGHVVAQEPAAGTHIAMGTEIKLTLGVRGLATRNRVIDRMQENNEFRKIGFSVEKLKERLDALNVLTRDQVAELVQRSDRELRDDLDLPTPSNAAVFKRLLGQALKRTKGG